MDRQTDPVNAEALQAAWDDGYEAAREKFTPTTATIPIPYEGYQHLVIDPVSENTTAQWALQDLLGLTETSGTEERFEEEVERILRAAVILFNAKAGTIGECIETAIIWERG